MRRAVLVAMAGKITKLAAGVMMTHFHRSKVDTDLLARVARRGVGSAAASSPRRRRPQPLGISSKPVGRTDFASPLAALCRAAARPARPTSEVGWRSRWWMVDFDGTEVVARA